MWDVCRRKRRHDKARCRRKRVLLLLYSMLERVYRTRKGTKEVKDSHCSKRRSDNSNCTVHVFRIVAKGSKQLRAPCPCITSSVLGGRKVLQRDLGCNKGQSVEYGYAYRSWHYCRVSIQPDSNGSARNIPV